MAKIPMNQPIDKKNLSEQVYDRIKRMILNSEIKGGERISEEEIAKSFGLSRTPIREALRRLERYGLITIKPRQYAEVVKLSLEDKEHIGKIRILLDTLAVDECIGNATDEDCDHLEEIARECISLASRGMHSELFEKDSQFHMELARISGNPYLFEIMQNLDVKVQLLRATVYSSEEDIKKGPSHHLPLTEAIRKRKKREAKALIKEHLEAFYYPG